MMRDRPSPLTALRSTLDATPPRPRAVEPVVARPAPGTPKPAPPGSSPVEAHAVPTARPRTVPHALLTWATTLVLVAGILHLVLAPAHLGEARGQGLFFIVLGVLQVGWSITYLRRPSRASYLAGMAGMAVMPIVAYVGARFVAPPFSDGPEGWDIIGVATLVAEAVAALLLAFHGLRAGFATRRLRPAGLLAVGVAAGLVLAGALYGLGRGADAMTPWFGEPEGEGGHGAATEEVPAAPDAGAGHHAAASSGGPAVAAIPEAGTMPAQPHASGADLGGASE